VCYDQKIVATRYHWHRPRLLSKFPCTVTFARSPRKIRFALHARGTPRASPLPDDMMAVGSGRHHPKPTTFSPAEAVPAVRAIHTSGSAPTLSFPEKRKKEKKKGSGAENSGSRRPPDRPRTVTGAQPLSLGNADIYSSH
jgi:hypothetical protein